MFGESSEEALAREIKEELKINIKDYKPFGDRMFLLLTDNGKKIPEKLDTVLLCKY